MADDTRDTTRASEAAEATPAEVATEPDLEAHPQVGRFILLGKLGAGGMGVVYTAYDLLLDRKVALKMLRPGRFEGASAVARERLLREAKAMARLSHPNVVTVHEAGIVNEQVFLAMELIDGQNLRSWLRAEPHGAREILRAFLAAGRGLAAAHEAGLVHRDFKPDNVLCARDGRVLVTDFGIAWQDPAEPSGAEVGLSPPSPSLTRTGAVVGTPSYMSPEQHAAAAVDARSDQYSFCAALYEALEGVPPFSARGFDELAEKVRTEQPAPPSRMPAWLRAPVMRGLRREPAERFDAMAGLLAALERDPAPRRRAVAVSLLAVALVAVGAVALARRRPAAEVCAGVAARAQNVWGPEVAKRVRAAFQGSGKPYAADAFTRVDGAISAYLEAWSAMRVEACTAAEVKHEQSAQLMDLRVLCLNHRLDSVDALVAVLGRAGEPGVLEKAAPAALTLEPLDGCADVAGLTAAVPPPPAAVRERVEALRTRLSRVRANVRFTPGKNILGEAGAAVADARALPYPPILAAALYELGRADMEVRDVAGAEQVLNEAAHVAAAAKDDRQLTEILTDLMMTLAAYANRPKDALALRLPAEVALLRGGDPAALRGQLLYTLGGIQRIQGDLAQSETLIAQAAEVLDGAYGHDNYREGRVLVQLGRTYTDEGKFDEARRVFERVRAIYQRSLGPDHPDTGLLEQQYATLLWKMGDYTGAEAGFRGALDVIQRAYGPEHPKVINVMGDLVAILCIETRVDEARALYERTLALREKVFGEDADLSLVLDNFANLMIEERRYAEALPLLDRATAIIEKRLGADSWVLAAENLDRAAALTGLGRLDEALALEQEAYPILRKSVGEIGDTADAAVRLVDTLLALRRAADALPYAEDALRFAGGKGAAAVQLARARFALARTLDALGRDPDRAASLAAQAHADYAAHPVGQARAMAEVEAWQRAHAPR